MPAAVLSPIQQSRVDAGVCACGCAAAVVRPRQLYASHSCRQRAYLVRRGDPAVAQALRARADQERARARDDESRGRRLLQRAYRRRQRAALLVTLSLEIPCESP